MQVVIEREKDTSGQGPGRACPVRTCVGCGRREAASALVRLVLGPGGQVAADVAGGAFGRGAHVHPRRDCLSKAARGGLARAFKQKVDADPAEVARQIVEACDRRMTGLFVAAQRAKEIAVGADAACEALEAGAPLAIVACDAGTIVSRGPVAAAIAAGRAIAWKDKVRLGALLGRDEVAVCALKSEPIAARLREARMMADALAEGQSGSLAWSPEVR